MPRCNVEGSSCPLLGRMTIYVNQMFTSLLSKSKSIWFNLNLLNHNSAKVCHLQTTVSHLENFMRIWHTCCWNFQFDNHIQFHHQFPPLSAKRRYHKWFHEPYSLEFWTPPLKVHKSYIIVIPPSMLKRVPYLFHLSTTQSGYAKKPHVISSCEGHARKLRHKWTTYVRYTNVMCYKIGLYSRLNSSVRLI